MIEFQNLLATALNEAIKVILPILIAFIAAVVALSLNTLQKWLALKFGEVEAGVIGDFVLDAIGAAEQYLGSASGQEKKDYAITHAQAALKKAGINIDVKLLGSWVEAEIAFQKDKTA